MRLSLNLIYHQHIQNYSGQQREVPETYLAKFFSVNFVVTDPGTTQIWDLGGVVGHSIVFADFPMRFYLNISNSSLLILCFDSISHGWPNSSIPIFKLFSIKFKYSIKVWKNNLKRRQINSIFTTIELSILN